MSLFLSARVSEAHRASPTRRKKHTSMLPFFEVSKRNFDKYGSISIGSLNRFLSWMGAHQDQGFGNLVASTGYITVFPPRLAE